MAQVMYPTQNHAHIVNHIEGVQMSLVGVEYDSSLFLTFFNHLKFSHYRDPVLQVNETYYTHIFLL